MTKVISHLNAKQLYRLRTIKGQTDGDKVRWLVDFFDHLVELRAAKEKQEQRPKIVSLLTEAGEAIAGEAQVGG